MLFPLKRGQMVWELDRREAFTQHSSSTDMGDLGARALRFHNDAAKRRVSPSSCSHKPPTHLKCLSINLLNTKD